MLERNLILDDDREEVSEETLLSYTFRNRGREIKEEYEKHKKSLKSARTIMLVNAILGLLADIFLLANDSYTDGVSWAIVAGYFSIMIGLYVLSFRQPLLAFVIFLILFLGMWILSILGNTDEAYRGIFLRGLAVFLLIKGAVSAGRVQGTRKELVSRYLHEREREEREQATE